MKKLLMMCLILSSCIHVEPPVEYKPKLKIIEHDGKKMVCQSKDDIKTLYEKLKSCGP